MMYANNQDFQPELLWGERHFFLNIEERTRAYRRLYMERGTGQGWQLQPEASEASKEPETMRKPEVSKKPEIVREPEVSKKPEIVREPEVSKKPETSRNPETSTEPEVSRDSMEGHSTESRMMEGDFATLLCLYGSTGEEHSISRQGRHLSRGMLPRQGRYHKHQYIEVFYVIEGSFEQILLGEKRHFSQGEVVITDQNCEHADYINKEDAAVLFLWLKPAFLDELLRSYEERDDLHRFLFHALDRQKREQSFLELKAENRTEPGASYQTEDGQGGHKVSEEMGALLEQLAAEDYGRRPGAEEIIRGCLIRLFHLLCTSYALQLHSSDQESKEKVLLYELERYIRLHAAEVTAAELEESFHYHRNYYNLLLRKYKGKSFREYVQEIRIRQAKELLLTTRLPLKQIAASVGYENTSFFYHLFERVEGVSPGELRK